MKKVSMLLAVFAVMILTQACAQTNSKVPAKVKAAFTQKFPTAKKAKWDKENATEWEVEFKMNREKYSANFSSDGVWKETEYEIEKSDIPAAVKQSLNNEFAGYDVEEVEVSETPEGKVFEFALEKDDNDLKVAISPDGKIVKNENKKEENSKESEEENEEKDND
ncbi:MAG TPA: hypothetical protein ENK91_09135 [Bacteroidetes bacterium]|nr:hypothetical protein [Bacteroidota bacterium]